MSGMSGVNIRVNPQAAGAAKIEQLSSKDTKAEGKFAAKSEGKGSENVSESNAKAELNKHNAPTETKKGADSTAPQKNPGQSDVTTNKSVEQRSINEDATKHNLAKFAGPSADGGADIVRLTHGKTGENPDQGKKFMEDRQQFATNMDRGGTQAYVARRKKSIYDEDEQEGGQQRRRKPASFQTQQKKPLTVIEGARVGESQSQDMFVSSSYSEQRISGMKVQKTVIEQIKEYYLNDVGLNFYDIVYANYNHKEKNGIGPNMQKELFSAIVENVTKTDDVLSAKYKKLVRDIVQGSMRAGDDSSLEKKDLAKILVSGLMATSPHGDDPEIMAETVKIIVSEIMYGKINIGYNMRDAAGFIGAAAYTLSTYYKEYQKDINFDKSLENKIHEAFASAIWSSTGEISNFSTAYAKTNIEHFMNARIKEEESHQKSIVKNMILSPFKKVLNR